MNTHGSPDTLKEIQSIDYDLLPACIVSTTWPTTPGSGLTLPAFATRGYCRRGSDLLYVDQPARAVTVSSTAGNHWLALSADTFSTLAGWTRIPGSHYLEQANATQPASPDGALVFAQVVVTAGTVTAVTPLPNLATLSGAWRTFLDLGSMSVQNANAVNIVGGTLSGPTILSTTGAAQIDNNTFVVDPVTHRVGLLVFAPLAPLDVNGDAYLRGKIGIGTLPFSGAQVNIDYNKSTMQGMYLHQLVSDTGGGSPVLLTNVAGSVIGSIGTNATSTSFNTSSDPRLKEAVTTLVGALEVVQRLRAVSFRWRADGSPGVGFLANEVQAVVPEAVSGTPDAVTDDGQVQPMQMDMGKLVPYLVGGLQALLARVEALEAARLAS